MDSSLRSTIMRACKADDAVKTDTIQSLWSGYGSIDRYRLSGGPHASVVVKHVRLPHRSQHPRGWNSDRSHQRKLRSYQVETAWYQNWAARCDDHCRIPLCLALEQHEDDILMVLEDLDASGYAARKDQVNADDMHACLHWLAHFHSRFIGVQPQGLWPVGSYWHLATRPDELAAMADGPLKQAAAVLDQTLNAAPFQTLVHGDAKLANFCFASNAASDTSGATSPVAAVDFQYVGGGCGIKDVAYFIGSCLDEDDCERWEQALLDVYFSALREALASTQPQLDAAAVEAAWRPLYSVAWTDFYRFLKGWSPGHWKIHGYSERLADKVLKQLQASA